MIFAFLFLCEIWSDFMKSKPSVILDLFKLSCYNYVNYLGKSMKIKHR